MDSGRRWGRRKAAESKKTPSFLLELLGKCYAGNLRGGAKIREKISEQNLGTMGIHRDNDFACHAFADVKETHSILCIGSPCP